MFIELERQRAALYSQRRRNRRLVEPFLTPGCWRHGPLWTGSMRLGRVIVRETFKDTRGFAHRIGAYRCPTAVLHRRRRPRRCLVSLGAVVAMSSSRPAARHRVERPQLSIDISCPLGTQQQTCRPPLLLSIDGTDRRTDARSFHRLRSAYRTANVNNGRR